MPWKPSKNHSSLVFVCLFLELWLECQRELQRNDLLWTTEVLSSWAHGLGRTTMAATAPVGAVHFVVGGKQRQQEGV